MTLETTSEADRVYMRDSLAGITGPAPGFIYVGGDSTAAGVGSANTDARWATMSALDAGITLVNIGIDGQGVADGVAAMLAQTANRTRVTVFKDHRNAGESATYWLAQIAQLVAVCPYILIEPQLGVTNGSMDAAALQVMADINAGIIAQFPNNTYPADVQGTYIAALSNADTRDDGLHRNDLGQAIEALFISAFFRGKGWRRQKPETFDALARMQVQPSAWDKALLNGFIERQIGSGRWSKSDVLYNALLHDEQASTLNLISAGYNATKTGTVSFTPYRGFTGDGSTGRHGTGFNPAQAPASKFQQDSAHLLVHNLTNVAESKSDIGSGTNATGASLFNSRNADNGRSIMLNQATTVFGSGATTSKGRFGVVRKDAANVSVAVNIAVVGSQAAASATPGGGEVWWGAAFGGGNFSTKQRAFASIGGALSDVELRHSYYSEAAFAKAVGAL